MAEKEKKTTQLSEKAATGSRIVMIRTELLRHHPENPRKNIGDITELAESMKKNGVMQNLTVIPVVTKEMDYNPNVPVEPFEEDPNNDTHRYFVLIGNRRMEAAKADSGALRSVPLPEPACRKAMFKRRRQAACAGACC